MFASMLTSVLIPPDAEHELNYPLNPTRPVQVSAARSSAAQSHRGTLADQVIKVRDGNEVGYGIIAYGIGKGYAMYEAVQAHPAI